MSFGAGVDWPDWSGAGEADMALRARTRVSEAAGSIKMRF